MQYVDDGMAPSTHEWQDATTNAATAEATVDYDKLQSVLRKWIADDPEHVNPRAIVVVYKVRAVHPFSPSSAPPPFLCLLLLSLLSLFVCVVFVCVTHVCMGTHVPACAHVCGREHMRISSEAAWCVCAQMCVSV